MKINIKRLHLDAVIPSYSKDGDAGMDLTAICDGNVNDYGTVTFKTGLAIEIPRGYVGLVFPRSSVYKSTGRLANCVGVIDSGYRGELLVNFDVSLMSYIQGEHGLEGFKATPYKKGDRIAQIIILPYPEVEFEEVEELSETERGTGGYGSTGK